MKVWWRICGRFYAVRAKRAEARAKEFRRTAEKFFHQIKGKNQNISKGQSDEEAGSKSGISAGG